MSQRKLSFIKQCRGGLTSIQKAAKRKGIRLLLLTDDKDEKIVAASFSRKNVTLRANGYNA